MRFVELTGPDGQKMLINLDYIQKIEHTENGGSAIFYQDKAVEYVREAPEQIFQRPAKT